MQVAADDKCGSTTSRVSSARKEEISNQRLMLKLKAETVQRVLFVEAGFFALQAQHNKVNAAELRKIAKLCATNLACTPRIGFV